MGKLWRITPLHKKSIDYFIDVYEEQEDGTIRGFDVTFCYRWGQGFRDESNPPNKWESEQDIFYTDTATGWGCELDDLCAVHINFGDGFSEEEKAEIEALCNGEAEDDEGRWGEAWLFDGEHNWQIEEDTLYIHKPFKIDLVDETEYNVVLEENVTLED